MSTKEDILKQARDYLAGTTETEVGILEELPGAEELWKEIQQVKQEMYDAKRKAAEEAAEPYLKKLEKLEEQYALIIKLTS